jgi:hypothetical protein
MMTQRLWWFLYQNDIKELVQYAKDRFINILPEIDVPVIVLLLLLLILTYLYAGTIQSSFGEKIWIGRQADIFMVT